MSESLMTLLAVLAPGAPLLAALMMILGYVMGWCRLEPGEKSTALIAVPAAAVSLLSLVMLGLYSLWQGAPGTLLPADWLRSGDYSIRLSLLVDPLSLAVATVFSLVLLLISRFAVHYMHREAGFQRFFIVLSPLHSGVLLLVLAGNVLLTLAGWGLMSVSGYLLMTYAWQHTTMTANALRVFIAHRLGTVFILLAGCVALVLLQTTEWELLLSHSRSVGVWYEGLPVFWLVMAALLLSAQLPFSGWLSRALDGPVPAVAVLYTVVLHSGVFLLLRIAPLPEQSPLLAWLVLGSGLLTVVYSWLCALVQTNLRTALAYRTLTQVGLMVMAIGLGWQLLATGYLLLHVLWRTYQWLYAPAIVQQARIPTNILPGWLRRQRALYRAALHNFWLDELAERVLVQPVHHLARSVRRLADKQWGSR